MAVKSLDEWRRRLANLEDSDEEVEAADLRARVQAGLQKNELGSTYNDGKGVKELEEELRHSVDQDRFLFLFSLLFFPFFILFKFSLALLFIVKVASLSVEEAREAARQAAEVMAKASTKDRNDAIVTNKAKPKNSLTTETSTSTNVSANTKVRGQENKKRADRPTDCAGVSAIELEILEMRRTLEQETRSEIFFLHFSISSSSFSSTSSLLQYK